MAIGRISGPMLYSNLERQGVDLAIEGNIFYVNVTNRRIGANTTNPNAELQVVGTANLANISITGNTISSDLGVVNFGNPANITLAGGGADYVLVTDGSGNLRWDEISNLDQTWGNLLFSNNRISITNVNGNLELAANGAGFVVALNNFYAPNVIAGNVNAVYFNGNIRTAEIVSSGNILSANVQATFYGNIFGNVTGTNGVFSSNIDAQYFNGNVRSTNVVSTGNISAPYFVGDLVGNIAGQLQGDVFGNITGNNASFTGNVSSGWFNGNITGSSSNFTTANAALFYGNIFAQQVTSSVGDLHLSAATDNPNNIIRFDSVSAFDIPSGTTAQRPPAPDYGYVRYNTDLGTIEWWGGSTWVPGSNLIVSENITPDGSSAVYTLGQSTTENAILVNINGTIQQAGAGAYSVSGNQITFAEVPLVTDIIEIRYIAGGVAALSFNFANISSNVSPSANVTYDLGSPNYRWRDLWLSGNTINLGSATLSAVGNTIQLPAGSTVGGANVDATFAATNAAIITANIGMKSYVDRGLAEALIAASSYGNAVVQIYLPVDPTIISLRANNVSQETKILNIVNTANANTAAYLPTYSGNVGGTLTTVSQPNITTLAGLTSFGGSFGSTTAQGNLTVVGNLTVQGNTITVGSNNLTVTDSIIDLHTPANLQQLISDDGRDIGFRFHYYKGSDDHAFFGWENQTQTLIYLQRSDEINSNITGTYGNVQFGSLRLANTTPSTTTTTGALVVNGGVGVAGNINVGSGSGNAIVANGNVVVTGSLIIAGTGGGVIPPGGIIMWSGLEANIPTGWLLCNGSNGTPDLRNRFVVGAGTGSSYAVAATGGTADAVVVSHSHTASVSDPGHSHAVPGNRFWVTQTVGRDGVIDASRTVNSTDRDLASENVVSNTTGITVGISTEGASGTNANLPPYYALCYIMKS